MSVFFSWFRDRRDRIVIAPLLSGDVFLPFSSLPANFYCPPYCWPPLCFCASRCDVPPPPLRPGPRVSRILLCLGRRPPRRVAEQRTAFFCFFRQEPLGANNAAAASSLVKKPGKERENHSAQCSAFGKRHGAAQTWDCCCAAAASNRNEKSIEEWHSVHMVHSSATPCARQRWRSPPTQADDMKGGCWLGLLLLCSRQIK